MTLTVPRGSWALVTGASSGIGEAIARRLAARGVPLLLAARSLDRLEALAAELAAAHGIEARAVRCDLSAPGGAEALVLATEGAGTPVDLLVNNAGFGLNGATTELPPGKVLEMLQVNVLALTELTQRLLPAMAGRGHGRILNVSSTMAFLAAPYFAAYAASKAYVLSYSLGLREEAAPLGITVTCLCPGNTRTNFAEVAGMNLGRAVPSMRADDVAEAGLAGLEKGEATVLPNVVDRAWVASTRLLPRTIPAKLGALLFSRSRTQAP